MNFEELEEAHYDAYLTNSFVGSIPDFQTRYLAAVNFKEKINEVYKWEHSITPHKDLYLFTWAPNPEDLPNSDFCIQHEFNVNIIADFLKTCYTGLCCVESTQIANPHYHGWYQLSDDPLLCRQRIAIIKTLKRCGLLKITKSKGHYRPNTWHCHANCLFYYKKDLLTEQLLTVNNPISRDTKTNIDWNSYSYNSFFIKDKGRQSVADIEDRVNLRDFYKQFYSNSIN